MVLEFLNDLYLGQWTNLIQFSIALVIGFVLGKLAFYFVEKTLSLFNFNTLANKSGLSSFIYNIGYKKDAVSFVGDLFKWTIYLLFLVISLNFLFGVGFSDAVTKAILLYFPKVVSALVIVVIGFVVSDFFGNLIGQLVDNLLTKWKEHKLLSSLSALTTKILVFFAILIISLDLFGIYVEVLTVSFAIVFFSLVLILIVGGKDLLLNMFAGFYLQAISEVKCGSQVSFGSLKGELLEIGFVYSKVRVGNKIFFIPNSQFLKETFGVKP